MGTTADPGLALVRAGVDLLLSGGRDALDSAGFAALVSDLEVERRRLEAVDVQVVAEAVDRGLATEFCATSLPDLIGGLTRVSRRQAQARVRRAVDLGPRRAVSGESLEPIHPQAAAALRAGEISGAHVDEITHCIGRIPAEIELECFDVAEAFLVEAARHEDPAALRRTGQVLLARLDQDGMRPREDELERRRSFGFRSRSDGSRMPFGSISPEAEAVWAPILSALSAPVPAGDDGLPDPRSAGQRMHDAFFEAGQRLLNSGTLPAAGGAPTTITITIEAADYDKARRGESGALAVTGHGQLIDAEQFLRLTGEADIYEVVVSPLGGVLDYGRTRRLASCEQRRALAARDGGCCFPGCTRPAAWAEVHHVITWLRHGPTSLDNLCLLCSFHHRTFEKAGWVVEMCDGVPQWIPPAWLDPSRRPRRNTAHHLPEIDFAQ